MGATNTDPYPPLAELHWNVVQTKQIRSSAWLEHYTDNVGVSSSNLLGSTEAGVLKRSKLLPGGLAQLARASALHAEGHRFDSDILH
jgi:hypothetical protein